MRMDLQFPLSPFFNDASAFTGCCSMVEEKRFLNDERLAQGPISDPDESW